MSTKAEMEADQIRDALMGTSKNKQQGAAESTSPEVSEVAGALAAEPGVDGSLASPPDTVTPPPAQELVGDPSRWKVLDPSSDAYEIKDRGVIFRSWAGVAFIPGVKLAADINNGHRIVAG